MLAVWLRTGGQERERERERERGGLVRTFGTLWVGWDPGKPYGSSGNLWNSMDRVGTYETLWIGWEPVELCGLAGNLGNHMDRVGTYGTIWNLWVGWESGREQTTTPSLAFNMVGGWK